MSSASELLLFCITICCNGDVHGCTLAIDARSGSIFRIEKMTVNVDLTNISA